MGTGDGTGDLLATGSSGQALIVGGSDASGLEWGTPSSAAVAPINDGEATCLAQTLSRSLCVTQAANALLSGVAVVQLVGLYENQVIGHLTWCQGTIGTTGPENHWMALLDTSGHLLATTLDNTTTAISANSVQTLAIGNIASGSSSTYTVPSAGQYYIALNVTSSGSTGSGPISAAAPNATLQAVAPTLSGTFGSGLTGPVAFPYTATIAAANSGTRRFAALS